MRMWFWFGSDLGSFLFPGYNVASPLGLFCTCLGLISLAVLYEAMKVLQIKLRKRTSASIASDEYMNSENSSLLTQIAPGATGNFAANWKKWATWSIEVLHWSSHTTLGYLLMLAVMTYNGYIAIALAIGATLGYWIFGITLIELNLEQFKQERSKIVRCDSTCADAADNAERRPSTVSIVAEQLAAEVESVTAVESIAEVHAPVDA